MDISEISPLQSGARRDHVLACSTNHDSEPEFVATFVPHSTEQRQAETEHDARCETERANRSKSEFLSTVSHELRTPLNAILGYAQCLDMDKGLTERQRRSIQAIRDSGEHLLSLIVDILDLSRIEAQHLELLPTPVELRPFLRSVAEVIRVKADEKGLILALDADCNLPEVVLVDQRRLRQVLLNLLGNAVKFTDRGTISLCVSEVRREGDHSLVRIDVRDTGVGMSPQELPTIFEPFKQVGDIRRREAGTGLGLTITRALVAAMGGDIRVKSELGRGTQFSFTLRMEHADTPDRAGPAQNRPVRYEGHRRRVLVIDDDVHARSIFSDFLASIGFECQVAEDGRQGVDKVHSFLPDVVLMDTLMPVMSGLEATRRLRADPALARLPIIAVTANAAEADRQDCLQAGATLCLCKPVRLDELACAIQQLLHLVPRPHTQW